MKHTFNGKLDGRSEAAIAIYLTFFNIKNLKTIFLSHQKMLICNRFQGGFHNFIHKKIIILVKKSEFYFLKKSTIF